jgi:hypothetical protein
MTIAKSLIYVNWKPYANFPNLKNFALHFIFPIFLITPRLT